MKAIDELIEATEALQKVGNKISQPAWQAVIMECVDRLDKLGKEPIRAQNYEPLKVSFVVACHDKELQTIEVMQAAFTQCKLTAAESGRVEDFIASVMHECTKERRREEVTF